MTTAIIHTKEFFPEAGEWVVYCTIETVNGTRIGRESVYGSESMNDEQIKSLVLSKYLTP